MAEVVLDANVIVALLYADDSLHQRAVDLTTRLENEGHSLVLVDRPSGGGRGRERRACDASWWR